MMSGHKYVVGEKVWVVQIPDRRGTVKEGQYKTVVKVGKVYGYLDTTWSQIDARFELSTGSSHAGAENWNHRANGYGFDVYPSKEAYDQHMADKAEAERLSKRLLTGYTPRLVDLSPWAVESIHHVLNQEGIEAALKAVKEGE